MIQVDISRLVPAFLLNDRNGRAMAKALEAGMRLFCRTIQDGLDTALQIEKMPEWRLDELSWELGCLYDYDASLENKRAWIRDAVPLYTSYGTPEAIYKYLGGYFEGIEVEEGWRPGGNSDFGHCWKDAYRYETGKAVQIGTRVGWRGWLYECLISHTTTAELSPDRACGYWKRLRRIGGAEAYPELRDESGRCLLTLNGTGPMNWHLDGSPGGMCDAVGNLWEMDYGYRIVDGEIQILANNDAADTGADLSASSSAWRAILPNAGDDGYRLVTPGTAGTLHWTWANGKITLDTAAPVRDGFVRWTKFKDLAVNAANVPYVPCILRELGLFPTEGSTVDGICGFHPEGERLALRGGSCESGTNMGLGAEICVSGRDSVSLYGGGRIRIRDEI